MRGVERVGDLDAEIEDLVDRQRLAGDVLIERLPVEQLHRDELPALELADVVDRADRRMIEGRGGSRLALEPLERQLIRGRVGGQEFQRERAAEPRVLGLVNHTHAARTDLLDDTIVGDDAANHAGRGFYRNSRRSRIQR